MRPRLVSAPGEHSEILYQRFRNGRAAFRTPPHILTDAQLRRLAMPTLVLVGGQEFLFDSARAVAPATRVLPLCRAELIAGCNHAMVTDQPAEIARHLRRFLQDDCTVDAA